MGQPPERAGPKCILLHWKRQKGTQGKGKREKRKGKREKRQNGKKGNREKVFPSANRVRMMLSGPFESMDSQHPIRRGYARGLQPIMKVTLRHWPAGFSLDISTDKIALSSLLSGLMFSSCHFILLLFLDGKVSFFGNCSTYLRAKKLRAY